MTVLEAVAKFAQLHQGKMWVVAYSGGMDSHCLIHALAPYFDQNPIRVVHINHGIQTNANAWALHCQAQCQRLQLPLTIETVDASPHKGESQEQAARRARYAALEKYLDQKAVLLVAHHQRDQAETLLLRLMRGTGVKGLRAMQTTRPIADAYLVRPLLDCSYQALKDYAEQHSLDWIDDPSNSDTTIQRNFIRNKIIVSLATVWPRVSEQLSKSARLMDESQTLLDDLASIDWQRVSDESKRYIIYSAFKMLSYGRQKNLMRYWLSQKGLREPQEQQLVEFLRQLDTAKNKDSVVLNWADQSLRYYDNQLYAFNGTLDKSICRQQALDFSAFIKLNTVFRMLCQRNKGSGLQTPKKGQQVSIRYREGGEKCLPVDERHHRSLKQQFQKYRIPSWLRPYWPLIYYDNDMAAGAGLWINKGFACQSKEEWGYQINIELNL